MQAEGLAGDAPLRIPESGQPRAEKQGRAYAETVQMEGRTEINGRKTDDAAGGHDGEAVL